MSEARSQPQQALDVQEMQFWLGKVFAWSRADQPHARHDMCHHFSRLKDFLQQLLAHIRTLSSTTETMRSLPSLGQFLGRLCWIPFITADDTSRGLILQCLWGMYSDYPSSAVERKTNQWIRSILCHLGTEEEEDAQIAVKHMGVPPTQYRLRLLTKIVARLQENAGKSCGVLGDGSQRCSCDSALAASDACVPLLTCAEAAPLIGALLRRPPCCTKSSLSEYFLDAVSAAYSSHRLPLEDEAVVLLWYRSLSSLEEAVLRLLGSALARTESTPQELELQTAQSLLPKACAQHCSIFLVVNDIFRSFLEKQEDNECVRSFIQTFTSCFFKELTLVPPQTSAPLKAFFPRAPQTLLLPLWTRPSEMPPEAWTRHLKWLSGSLQRLTEEEEAGDGDGGSRGQHTVFEAWFLLVQCAHWVQVTVQLLVTGSAEDCGPLLWLLTFYHHPTNRGHHRNVQLVKAREALEQLHLLFSIVAPPPPADWPAALLLPHAQQPSLARSLVVNLLVNSAVFSQQPLSRSTDVFQTVVLRSGLTSQAEQVLSSLELRLNEGSCSSCDADRVRLRIKALQNTLTDEHTHTAPPPHPPADQG